MLFTQSMLNDIDTLIQYRKSVNITSDYLFGKPDSNFPIRGCDCLQALAKESGLKSSDLLTSTKLRK